MHLNYGHRSKDLCLLFISVISWIFFNVFFWVQSKTKTSWSIIQFNSLFNIDFIFPSYPAKKHNGFWLVLKMMARGRCKPCNNTESCVLSISRSHSEFFLTVQQQYKGLPFCLRLYQTILRKTIFLDTDISNPHIS